MKFSIIIPTFNSENTIIKSVTSVEKQTYHNWELIIVDDASSDNTVQKLRVTSSLSHEKIKIIQNKFNYGAGKARNIGIQEAVGGFIAFLDSDDTWSRNKLEIFNREIQRNIHKSVFFSQYNTIKKNRTFLSPNVKRLDLNSLLKQNYIGLSTVVLNKAMIKSNDIYFSQIRKRQDYEFWLRLLESQL